VLVALLAASPECYGWAAWPLTCADVVSEGGLEPLADVLSGSPERWLSV
jgi:hypothetical protein